MKRRATLVTLADRSLDGYAGRVDVYTVRRRRWWERLLRRSVRPTSTLWASVRGTQARTWKIR